MAPFCVKTRLHRRYRDFPYVFTALQILALALCVWTGRGS
jgi:hypothetical protein